MGKPDKIVDSLLVISYRSGDKKAFDLLVRRWNKRLCSHAYGYVKDWSVAKDVTQDTWSTVLKKIHTLRDTNCFGSWAMTIVSRKSLDVVSRQKPFKKEIDSQFWDGQKEFEDTSEYRDNKIKRVKAIMAHLPFERKMVLKLFYLEEYSLNEISAITGASLNTVKTRLFRAREKIKKELKI